MFELALFPLKTVLFPGNPLALKIFEPRYIDMVADCLRDEREFGVVLIRDGEEVGEAAEIYSVGCTARITDWEHRADGLLGITAEGRQRFQIHSTRGQADGLVIGEVSPIEEIVVDEIPDQFHYLLELLDHISKQAGYSREPGLPFSRIIDHLIHLLPLDSSLKQRLLEISDGHDRAVILHAELIRLGIIQYVKPGA